MSAVIEKLIKKVKSLDDKKARRVLSMIDKLESAKKSSSTWENMAADPVFILPKLPVGKFRKAKPAKGKGIPASELLIRDRR
jgi:hypothetical protein